MNMECMAYGRRFAEIQAGNLLLTFNALGEENRPLENAVYLTGIKRTDLETFKRHADLYVSEATRRKAKKLAIEMMRQARAKRLVLVGTR